MDRILVVVVVMTVMSGQMRAAEPTFAHTIEPFLKKYCIDCHDDIDQEGGVALHDLGLPTQQNVGMWSRVWEVVALKKMPPPKKKMQPDLWQRYEVSQWITGELEEVLEDHGGFSKHLHPKKANHLDHDLLFNTPLSDLDLNPASTPARRWRLHPQEHLVRLNDLMNRKPFDSKRPFGRARGDLLVPNQFGAVKVYYGMERYIGHNGMHYELNKQTKGFPALLGVDAVHGLRNYAHMYSVSGPEAVQIASIGADILRYMAYGPELIAKPHQFADSMGDLEDKYKTRAYFGKSDGIFFSNTVERPLTPVYDLLQASSADEATIRKAVTYLYKALTLSDPTQQVEDTYSEIVQTSIAQMGKEEGAILGLSMIFLDDKALFREELANYGRPDQYGRVRLQGEELLLAVNAAFAFIEPNEQLRIAYRNGQLKTRKDVEREVRRILDDPAIRKPKVLQFFREYFDYDLAPFICKDEDALRELMPFLKLTLTHGNSMSLMTVYADRMVERALEKDQQVLRELLISDEFVMGPSEEGYYFLHENDMGWTAEQQQQLTDGELLSEARSNRFVIKPVVQYRFKGKSQKVEVRKSAFYGPQGWRPADLRTDPDGKRMGLLTHPAWLISHSDAMDNHAIHRGIWVLERLLGNAVPDVPITVDAMLPCEPGSTLRERMRVTRDKACWSCHQSMDPLGLPFEMFNHIGQIRTLEQGKPVDTSGEIVRSGDPELDGPVTDALDMLQRLAHSERVEQVFVRHVFRFWMGRNETLNDAPVLRAAHRAYRDNNGSMKELLVSLLTSDAFLYRKVH